MAKKNGKGGGGGRSTAKYLFKLGATLVGGAVLGEVLSPLTGPVSGPAIGISTLGLVVWGFKPSYLTNAALPALAVQALKSTRDTSPMLAAKAAVAGSTRALRAANAGTDDALARARALAGGK